MSCLKFDKHSSLVAGTVDSEVSFCQQYITELLQYVLAMATTIATFDFILLWAVSCTVNDIH